MDNDGSITNKSGNRPFGDVLSAYTSRRKVLAGGLGLAATTILSGTGAALAHGGDDRRSRGRNSYKPLLDFEPTLNDGGDFPMISPDYEYDVILPWGDPIVPNGPVFTYPPTAEEQAEQIGIGHDGMHYFPLGDHDDDDDRRGRRRGRNRDDQEDDDRRGGSGNRHGVLCLNCEFGDNEVVLDKDAPESLEDVRTSQHAHGITIVEIQKKYGKWQTVNSKLARRIHVNTPIRFSGPVARHPLLETPAGNRPRGTVNNCAMGVTPWGTYLTCEENFNGYFGATGDFSTPERDRYGFSDTGFGYGWFEFDPRFDLSNPEYQNEENRFG